MFQHWNRIGKDRMTDQQDRNPFWDFSLALYERPGVELACLRLQNKADMDVNLALLCCWLGVKGVFLPSDSLQHLADRTETWRASVIKPLRDARIASKTAELPVESAERKAFRDDLKRLELASERLLQDVLYRMLTELPGKDGRDADIGGLLRSNLSRYAGVCKVRVDAGIRTAFETLAQESLSLT